MQLRVLYLKRKLWDQHRFRFPCLHQAIAHLYDARLRMHAATYHRFDDWRIHRLFTRSTQHSLFHWKVGHRMHCCSQYSWDLHSWRWHSETAKKPWPLRFAIQSLAIDKYRHLLCDENPGSQSIQQPFLLRHVGIDLADCLFKRDPKRLNSANCCRPSKTVCLREVAFGSC